MKVALIIGKDKSTGIPGKNWRPILGRPMVEYPLMAAYHCEKISKIYVSTDSPRIVEIASKYSTKIINRPAELALPSSPTEDVFEHAWNEIKKDLPPNTPKPDPQLLAPSSLVFKKNDSSKNKFLADSLPAPFLTLS